MYNESHLKTTNDFGLADLEIGAGTVISGTFSNISWGSDTYYLKTEMDPLGGTAYQLMGTSQFLSVPYSFYAKSGGTTYNAGTGLSLAGTTFNSVWTANGNNIYNNNNSNVGIGMSNPLQKLSLNGTGGIWNNNKLEYYSNSGTTIKGYLGPGRNNDLTLRDQATGWLRIGSNNAPICFWTNNNVETDDVYQVVIDASGNLGINVPPSEKLHVNGNLRLTGSFKDASGDAGTNGQVLTSTATGTNWISLPNDGDWTVNGSNMYSAVSGNVGIGTSSPDKKLSVIGVVRGAVDVDETEYLEMSHGGSNAYVNWTGDGNLDFRYDNATLGSVLQTGGFNVPSGEAYNIGGNNILHDAGTNNIFAGYQAGLNNTGTEGTFLGNNAGMSANSGVHNSFIGCKAGQNNSTGDNNTFLGYQTGLQNTTGYNNITIGSNAGNGNTTGAFNVMIGNWAGGYNGTGSENVMLGYFAGTNCANQSGNVFLGCQAGRYEAGSNKLYIDNSSTAAPLIWGDFNTNVVKINGSLYAMNLPFGDKSNVQWDDATGQFYYDNSSRRYKENITGLDDDFSKLLSVNPKTYTRPNNPGVWEIGYIAEEFDAAGLNKLVWYGQDGKPEGINYDKIILYTNENVKKDHQRILELEREIEALKNELQHLKHQGK